MCTGDFFDVMQGPKDPRGSYDDLAVEYKETDYLGRVLYDAEDFLRPYAPISSS